MHPIDLLNIYDKNFAHKAGFGFKYKIFDDRFHFPGFATLPNEKNEPYLLSTIKNQPGKGSRVYFNWLKKTLYEYKNIFYSL